MVKLNFCMIGCCKRQSLVLDKFFINFGFLKSMERPFRTKTLSRNAFYFTSKALFVLAILNFLYHFSSVSFLVGEVDGNLGT